MLVPHNAIYTETRLISNTQPALTQDAQCLSLGWQHYLPQPLVPGLGAGYFIDYQLGGVLYTASNTQIYHTVHSNNNKPIIYNKPTRCNSGSIVFIKNYKYALHVLDALCVHLQGHYKL